MRTTFSWGFWTIGFTVNKMAGGYLPVRDSPTSHAPFDYFKRRESWCVTVHIPLLMVCWHSAGRWVVYDRGDNLNAPKRV